MTNEYGLDVDYFRKKLQRMAEGLDRWTPDELARECARMAKTAQEAVLREPEFTGIEPQPPIDDRAQFAAFHRRSTRIEVEQQRKDGSYNDGWTTGANLAWFARSTLRTRLSLPERRDAQSSELNKGFNLALDMVALRNGVLA